MKGNEAKFEALGTKQSSMSVLDRDEPTVIVSLPENDPTFAEAAAAAGADGVKIHLDLSHRASGRQFGSLADQAETVEAIADVGLPVGVVPGSDVNAVRRNLAELSTLPVSWVDAFAHHYPAAFDEAIPEDISTIMAPSETYSQDAIASLASLPVDAVELSTVPTDRYGEEISARDLSWYLDLNARLDLPTVVPSQLDLTPAAGRALLRGGISNFLLGVVVTEDTQSSVEETTSTFVETLRNEER